MIKATTSWIQQIDSKTHHRGRLLCGINQLIFISLANSEQTNKRSADKATYSNLFFVCLTSTPYM